MLYIVRGAPGSGKTTFARQLLTAGTVVAHFETDSLFTDSNGTYRFDPTKLKSNHAECLRQTTEALARGWSVVVSNTFTRLWELEPYLKTAKAHGHDVTVVRCRGTYPNVHGVPETKVKEMRDRIEPFPGETFHD